jgi:16S rRNA (cytosine967-C5)-methyltransferase
MAGRAKNRISPARRTAFDLLRRVDAERAYASVLLASIPDGQLSKEDRALAHEIVLGVLRWQKQLDYFIERYSQRPPARLDQPVLISLRIGLYQIRNLTRIPHSAAVNESVELVKQARIRSAAAFVNAVLRKAAARASDSAGDEITEPGEKRAVVLSHPEWLLDRWSDQLGEAEADLLALANNGPAPPAFRVNTLRATEERALESLARQGVSVAPSSLIPGAFTAAGGVELGATTAARDGLIYIQDPASQLVSLLVDPKPGETVIDLCAAPGSKTSHLAALAGDRARIIACDLRRSRISVLVATCSRLGVHSVEPLVIDAAGDLPLSPAVRVDRILIDAPCTGTGTLRQNPEIKWRLGPGDSRRLAEVQLSLLTNGSKVLKEGGRLVYSTCSIEPEENEEVIRRFLDGHSSFRIVRPDLASELMTTDNFVRTYPHRHAMDGFFAAVMEKRG